MSSQLPTYLSAETIAAMLAVDASSVYRWASSDATMPATRIGGVVRFEREALLAWLEARTQRRPHRQSGRQAS